ncbi:probable E3 ubiquitin-protein ligase HERC4 isoform X2 [Anneissia japonica]|uniref:probable E3 ubiquitin-protein ligase HERC4 isoform X2 n=1 Tax=Anneissia japonica TaxID=1529436 RepID=UPI00142561CF|nr:probable E3 ubiquitin-protein ligase HERC4 isoform X2 [Anneissia japonica]
MKIYGWGSYSDHQLGLGHLNDENTLSPIEVTHFQGRSVRQIACGHRHTLFVLDDGTVYSCGNNEQGQLGHDKTSSFPEQIKALETFSIRQAACGYAHNVVINNKGQLLSWGRNIEGQCAQSLADLQSRSRAKPRVIKSLSSHFIVQVSCGLHHTLALTKDGKIFSWGDNNFGQLGRSGSPKRVFSDPTELRCLNGLAFKQITCGGRHSFALTFSGTIFGWGYNKSGQLGLNDRKDRFAPTHLKSLRSQHVKYMACGENHSVMLTSNGGVFTFGDGTYGQLGHNSNADEINPKKVLELMGSTVTQVVCGREHTLAFVLSSGRIYSFGSSEYGQLGLGSWNPSTSPLTVNGPWVPIGPEQTPMGFEAGEGMVIQNIYSGGHHCFCVASQPQYECEPVDHRLPTPDCAIYRLDEQFIKSLADSSNGTPAPDDIYAMIKERFSSQACLNNSFLTDEDRHYGCGRQNHGVDLDKAREQLQMLGDKHNILSKISQVIFRNLGPSLPTSPPDIEALRLYLLLMECPTMQYPDMYLDSILSIGLSLTRLSSAGAKVIDTWWASFQPRHMNRILTIYKKAVVYLHQNPNSVLEHSVEISMNVLDKLHRVNIAKGEIVPYYLFYIPEITDEDVLRQHYMVWLRQQTDHFALENVHRQNFQSMLQPSFIDPVNPCLVLYIRRDAILHTTLDQLSKQGTTDLKKPLRVVFMGEEAMDVGGVKKEFFLLIFKEILDPKFGMFKFYSNNSTIWFNSKSFEERSMFHLVGILAGLAIYNHTIIDLPFSLALYKKLLQRPVNLEDMKHLDPIVASSMEALLDYEDPNLEEVFDLDFQISEEAFGQTETIELIPGGKDVRVTIHNKQEYVNLYIDYIFNESVKDQYSAFAEGFLQVCGGPVLQLFHPQELMAMVVGNENYDWEEFEHIVEYKSIYHKNNETIRFFWEVFHELTIEQKRKFLVFLTGSDRIPVRGMSQVKMIIQPVFGSTDFLPVAHTCFNLLDLPMYESKEKMREKFLMAVENAQGFGLV